MRDCLGRYILVQSVWCRPGLHEWLIPAASQVVGIGQLRCASLDPFHWILSAIVAFYLNGSGRIASVLNLFLVVTGRIQDT